MHLTRTRVPAALLALSLGAVALSGATAVAAPPPSADARAQRIAAAQALPPLPRTEGVATLPLDQKPPLRWTGIRPGVEIVSDGNAAGGSRLQVSYTRAKKSAAGVAFMLPAGALAGAESLAVRITAEPAQQLLVCLTDADGFVWTLPSLKASDRSEPVLLKLAELKPDRFQNSGRTAPAGVDLAALGMLTILDISGHMGGAEVACRWTIEGVAINGTATGGGPALMPAAPQEPAATKGSDGARAARSLLFEAMQRDPARRPEAIAALQRIVAENPGDGRSTLFLGAAHLWASADSATPSAMVSKHLAEAAQHFERAATLLPDDERLASWLHGSRAFLARREGRHDDVATELAKLRAATDADPCFHAVAFGMIAWDEPTDSPAFRDAVAFARRAFECGRAASSTTRNGERWPFNVQGFLVGYADLLARAGDLGAAEEALLVAAARPETAQWPRQAMVDDRLETLRDRVARFADQDRANDPPFAWASRGPDACVLCHGVR